MVAIFVITLFVLLAVLSYTHGADSRQLEKRQTDWPFAHRQREVRRHADASRGPGAIPGPRPSRLTAAE